MTMINDVIIREARYEDVPDIVSLFADDQSEKQREVCQEPLPQAYYNAFNEIDVDKNNYLIALEVQQKVIGTLQLTIIPNLTHQGGKRALIEVWRN